MNSLLKVYKIHQASGLNSDRDAMMLLIVFGRSRIALTSILAKKNFKIHSRLTNLRADLAKETVQLTIKVNTEKLHEIVF